MQVEHCWTNGGYCYLENIKQRLPTLPSPWTNSWIRSELRKERKWKKSLALIIRKSSIFRLYYSQHNLPSKLYLKPRKSSIFRLYYTQHNLPSKLYLKPRKSSIFRLYYSQHNLTSKLYLKHFSTSFINV